MNATTRPFSAPLSLEDHTLDLAQNQDLAFLLRSFRLWLIGLRHNAPDCLGQVWNDFAGRFGSTDGKQALAALANTVKVIQLNARRQIRHHPPCCRYLAPDEVGFFSFIAACQTDDGGLSQRHAEWLVKETGREALLKAGSSLAQVLQQQGLAINLQRSAPV